ncbi:MAG: hypothetical protein WC477_02655 [Patescibacteria group bacterium]
MKPTPRKNHLHHLIIHPLHGGVMMITLLILMAIMLGFAIVGIATVLNDRQGYIEQADQRSAEQAANACADTAIERLGLSSSYAGNETVSLSNGVVCSIFPIISGGGWTIQAEAWVNNRVARVQVQMANRNPVDITSWTKVERF